MVLLFKKGVELLQLVTWVKVVSLFKESPFTTGRRWAGPSRWAWRSRSPGRFLVHCIVSSRLESLLVFFFTPRTPLYPTVFFFSIYVQGMMRWMLSLMGGRIYFFLSFWRSRLSAFVRGSCWRDGQLTLSGLHGKACQVPSSTLCIHHMSHIPLTTSLNLRTRTCNHY